MFRRLNVDVGEAHLGKLLTDRFPDKVGFRNMRVFGHGLLDHCVKGSRHRYLPDWKTFFWCPLGID